MDLEAVMKQMDEGQKKIAAAATGEVGSAAAEVPQEANALAQALEKAAQAVTPEQNSGDAVAGLQAIAEKLASQEKEAEVTHAHLCGQAFADGAINKFAAYDAAAKVAAAQQPAQPAQPLQMTPAPTSYYDKTAADADTQVLMQKVAAQEYLSNLTENDINNASPEDLNKLAELNEASQLTHDELMKVAVAQGDEDALYKIAAEKGYAETMEKAAAEAEFTAIAEKGYTETMEKAAADYNAGAEQALSEVHTIAKGEFLKGAAEAEMLINHARAQQ